MSVTSGFFNSNNHDRVYDAEQLSSIFDGVITDGIFETVGNKFAVSAPGGMFVGVASGRAWFDHTWTYNDGPIQVQVEAADLLLNRIDTLVIETDRTRDVRKNSIKIVKGTAVSNPVRPTLTRTDLVNQYRLADIYVGANVTEITASNITTYIGTTECPFCGGYMDSYTKAETNSLLSVKADVTALNSKADVSALAAKADVSALNAKANASALGTQVTYSVVNGNELYITTK